MAAALAVTSASLGAVAQPIEDRRGGACGGQRPCQMSALHGVVSVSA